MKSKYNPSFQERRASANAERAKALASLRAKAPVAENVIAARIAGQLKRDQIAADKRGEKDAAAAAVKVAKAGVTSKAQVPSPATESDKKAQRDARYAARQNRK